MSESIYNIIPKEYNPPPKGPIYKSKYPPNIPPTGSTLGHHTTSRPIVSYHSYRSLIYKETLIGGFRLILSMEATRHLGT